MWSVGGWVWVERHPVRPDHQVSRWGGCVWMERHPDQPDHQVSGCGEWVVGCGGRAPHALHVGGERHPDHIVAR